MSYLGRWEINDLLVFAVNTHNTTGAAADADSAPTYRVYEDETGAAILTGSMAKLDDANTIGFYSEQITLSAANGFENGKCYTIYVSATVGGTTATTHHTFQVEAALATAAALSAVSVDVVTKQRTWFAHEYRAANIVEVGKNFAGNFACQPDLNPNTAIMSVASVTFTGPASVTATDLTVNRDRKQAIFTAPALATTGTYTVVVKVTTTDSQTIPTTCTLKVY